MAKWTIVGDPKRYEGSHEPSGDADFGFRFTLRSDGQERLMHVESATYAEGLTEGRVRQAVRQYLPEDTPPRRMIFARHGQFYPPPAAAES